MITEEWYAVLETGEVKAGKPVAYKRLNMDLVFWRDGAGQIVAMEDRCPHRQAKLSLGKVVDGNIQCAFHGFQFDACGDCKLIPANGKNGPRPKLLQPKVYPTTEQHGFIWLWYGQAQTEYPPVPFFDELQGMEYGTLRQEWAVHYSRAIENQLDVAHLPFVHYDTIGRGGRTLVNGPYTELKDNALYVWTDLQADQGQAAPRPAELTKPEKPWMLCFKFPNVWVLNISEKLRMMTAFVPVDEEHTMMYVRFYHDFVKNPLLRRTIAKVGALSNIRIVRQDKRIVESQSSRPGGLDCGDKYIPADRPIVLYYQHREALMRAATGYPAELNAQVGR